MNNVYIYYRDHECPDCGEPIPHTAVGGDECENCGHVFWGYKEPDDGEVG